MAVPTMASPWWCCKPMYSQEFKASKDARPLCPSEASCIQHETTGAPEPAELSPLPSWKARFLRRGPFCNRHRKSKRFYWSIVLICLGPLAFCCSLLSARFPAWTEIIYSQGIYPVLSRCLNWLSGLVPISLMELLFAVGIFFLLARGVLWLGRLWRTRGKRLQRGLKPVLRAGRRFLVRAACGISTVYFLFVFLCGLNYNRLDFATLVGYSLEPSSVEELNALCRELSQQAGELRAQIPQQGALITSDSVFDLCRQAAGEYDAISRRFPILAGGYSAPKPVLFSEVMSYLNITGVYFPFTAEANVNIASPDFLIPVTMCHELSHLRGFMREDEANFIAYLVCRESSDVLFEYSGTMLALIHASNALYSADPALYEELVQTYTPGMLADLRDNSEYWQRHEGLIGDISDTVNDTYLKANRQSDGVKSYGRMVDLLLAQRRLSGGLS